MAEAVMNSIFLATEGEETQNELLHFKLSYPHYYRKASSRQYAHPLQDTLRLSSFHNE